MCVGTFVFESVCVCVCVCVCVDAVWLCRGAEVSDCLVSVGSKLWRFALTVNLEEFLMELWSCLSFFFYVFQ